MNDRFAQIIETARRLLELQPDPVPRLRLVRDVLGSHAHDRDLAEARARLDESRWVKELVDEQHVDGGWGRFHTMSSKHRGPIPTTEAGVRRAIHLGLGGSHPVLRKAKNYLAGLLVGEFRFPDWSEANDRWAAGEEMFVAATLALIDPAHGLLGPVYEKWLAIAEETFADGAYDADREWQAHCRITGATTMRGSYLVLNNRYAVTLLGCAHERLSPRVESALMSYLWKHPGGLGYLDAMLSSPVSGMLPTAWARWFESQAIVSRFSSWRERILPACADLWDLRNREGFWDFGPQARGSYLRLSENWRRGQCRATDHSVHVLALLAKVFVRL